MPVQPQFNPQDEPVHNFFDLPVICSNDDPTRPCCGPCTDWLHCLRRAPLEMVLPGFDFSEWLPMVSMSASKLLPTSGAFSAVFTGSDGSNEFDGTYLAIPARSNFFEESCFVRPAGDLCESGDWGFGHGTWVNSGLWGWFGWWWGYWWDDPGGGYTFYDWYDVWYDYYFFQSWRATHHTQLPRVVYAPAAVYGQNKNFYVDASVGCKYNDLDQLCLEFTVLLRFSWEKPADYVCLSCTDAVYNIYACDPAIVPAIEAAEGWGTPLDEYEYCIPLMRSALIPIEGLVWSDLTEPIELEVIPPPVWELFDASDGRPSYWHVTGGSFGGGVFPELGPYISIGWVAGSGPACEDEFAYCSENGELAEEPPSSFPEWWYYIAGEHLTGYACNGPWLPVGCYWDYEGFGYSYYSYSRLCVPKPITVNEGPATIRVVSPSCRLPGGCGTCFPDPENSEVTLPARFHIEVGEGSSCSKTFTPVFTSCLDIDKVYWPWGDVTEGDDSVTHTIRNTAEGGVTKVELGTAIAIDTRGCIYCAEFSASCGCCEGVSGNLIVEQLDDIGCVLRLTGDLTGTEECPYPFIEYQLLEPSTGCPTAFFECDCIETDPELPDSYCNACGGTLGDGNSIVVNLSGGAQLRWRLWDRPCGCPSDWVEIPLSCTMCECCENNLTGVLVTLSGFADGEEGCECSLINGTYLLPQVNECRWQLNLDDHFACVLQPSPNENDVNIQVILTCSPGTGPGGVDQIIINGIVSTPPTGQIDYERTVNGTIPMDCTEALDGALIDLYGPPDPDLTFCNWGSMSLNFIGV